MGYNVIFDGVVPEKYIQHSYSETLDGSDELTRPDFDVTYNHDRFFDLVFANVETKNNETEEPDGEWWKKTPGKKNHGLYRLHGLSAQEQLAALQMAVEALPNEPQQYDQYGWAIYNAGTARRCLMIMKRITEYWVNHPELQNANPEMTGTWRRRF